MKSKQELEVELLIMCHHFLTDKWPLWLDSTTCQVIEHFGLEKAVVPSKGKTTYTLDLKKLPKKVLKIWLKIEEQELKRQMKLIQKLKEQL